LVPYADMLMEAAQLADVIRRARQGEAEAFDELVDAYSARLYGYFYRLTGGHHDAEDLLQETFVRLVRTIDRYEHDGRFDAWIFRIATNLVRDRVRRARRAPRPPDRRSPGVDDAPLEELPDADADEPGDRLHKAEQIDQLQQAIDRLPEAEREVILLRHFSQMSFKEVAGLMGTPLGTALARAHRGLAKLRELMAEE